MASLNLILCLIFLAAPSLAAEHSVAAKSPYRHIELMAGNYWSQDQSPQIDVEKQFEVWRLTLDAIASAVESDRYDGIEIYVNDSSKDAVEFTSQYGSQYLAKKHPDLKITFIHKVGRFEVADFPPADSVHMKNPEPYFMMYESTKPEIFDKLVQLSQRSKSGLEVHHFVTPFSLNSRDPYQGFANHMEKSGFKQTYVGDAPYEYFKPASWQYAGRPVVIVRFNTPGTDCSTTIDLIAPDPGNTR